MYFLLTVDLSNVNIQVFFFIKSRIFNFSLKGNTLQLPFGIIQMNRMTTLVFWGHY